VGGAKGSDLALENCPKRTGSVRPGCKAASMLMHLTTGSTAYLENVWLWTADHDMEYEKPSPKLLAVTDWIIAR